MWSVCFLVLVCVLGIADGSSGGTPQNTDSTCYHLVQGEPLELDCDTERSSGVTHMFPFTWTKNNKRFLPTGPDVHIEMTRLIFDHADTDDAGLYICSNILTAGYGQPTVGKLIHVITPIRVEPFPPVLVTRANGTLRLTCNASAIPRPHITWWHNGARLQGGGRVRLLPGPAPNGLPAGRLELNDLRDSDEGLYSCRGSHDVCGVYAEARTRVYVTLNAIRTNEEAPGKGIIMDLDSNTLVLQCNYTDDPTKDIVWYKDGAALPLQGDKYSEDSDVHTLTVKHPVLEDAGNYTCAVTGTNENTTIVVQVNVSIETAEQSKNQVEGDPLTLLCKATGFPIPTVVWLKDDEALNMSDPRISFETLDNVTNAKLVIQNLNFDDRAQYTCIASNAVGNDTMTIQVRVKDKLAALWPFLGICVEVAVLCAIIFVYEKKRVKPDFEESDADQNPENKNLSDQKEGHDIRQRK